MEHYSVLLHESIDGLQIKADGIYVDGTLGRAGHSSEILKRIPQGHLYSFDLDETAIEKSKPRLDAIGSNYTLIHSNFKNVKEALLGHNVTQVDGIVLDLGVSSPQFDDGQRGFSYRFDGPLDMRMDQSQSFSAYDVVNQYSFEDLVRILYRYGEENNAKLIARGIEKARTIHPIRTTFELAEVVKNSLPARIRNQKGHPAKQTFQAIRIEVNQELSSLEHALEDMLTLLKPNGILAIITFHSLEDRIVKTIFKEVSSPPVVDKRIPIKANEIPQAQFELVNRKPILPTDEELDENRRSHSAKLRMIRKR